MALSWLARRMTSLLMAGKKDDVAPHGWHGWLLRPPGCTRAWQTEPLSCQERLQGPLFADSKPEARSSRALRA